MNRRTHEATEPSSWEPLPGAPAAPGQPTRPCAEPVADTDAAVTPDSTVIPVGQPLSPEQYRAFKEAAQHTDLPATASAQEDP